jgi:SAM-dependent methyltransferase
MAPHTPRWLCRCETCGLLRTAFVPRIEDAAARAVVDEPSRAKALAALRMANFRRILDRLSGVVDPAGKRLLDVGCAHGWFLDAAASYGFDPVGLEPDPVIGAEAAAGGRCVWSGFFPDAVPAHERFDVITLNDVFEHLPDIAGALDACHRLLRPGGLLVLNVPCQRGIFYRAAKMFDRLGIAAPLERLWQIHFASPHLSYFAPEQLRLLAAHHEFAEIHASALPSIQLNGLWARLKYDTTSSAGANFAIWVGVVLASPFLRLLPADITVQIFRRSDSPRED